ncbi:hypothetical protein [Oceanobacillus saliphilus]|uniref:hypothetical protein n=1 Tax=Oceanobacillus saliphilus TaxID=2925834 RepID=UPI00201E6164|nr:hypothetical protein [Oceanobacillus saliphilus]
MNWIYIAIVIFILATILLFFKRKGRDPNHDASVTMEEKTALDEDYLSHGTKDNRKDREDI